jgi:hypothetical protein
MREREVVLEDRGMELIEIHVQEQFFSPSFC